MSCQQRLFGSHVHTFNYFVMSCPILRSFTFLSFGKINIGRDLFFNQITLYHGVTQGDNSEIQNGVFSK